MSEHDDMCYDLDGTNGLFVDHEDPDWPVLNLHSHSVVQDITGEEIEACRTMEVFPIHECRLPWHEMIEEMLLQTHGADNGHEVFPLELPS